MTSRSIRTTAGANASGGDGAGAVVDFAMVIHNHQPVDNDSAIIEKIFGQAYDPFLRTLARHPGVKATLHYTGYLLEWLEEHHADFVALLGEMVRSGQVELLAGGYYEPILVCIPDRDEVGQVDLLKTKLRSVFNSEAHGMWTAERAWEPQMPEVLKRCGIDYTALDDTIFMRAGLGELGCLQPYLVESRGSYVTVFPMSKRLRYLIPWKPPASTISWLRRISRLDVSPPADGGERPRCRTLAVFGDDGEKLGAWPGTHRSVYEEKWLDKFLQRLEDNSSWLRTVTLSGYLDGNTPHSRVYLGAASYDEMMEWAMSTAESGGTGRNRGRASSPQGSTGFWRGFLAKYPESARLYSKMLDVSEMLSLVAREGGQGEEALLELWKGQSNDVYWHGVFGGLYSTELRRIAYHHLIRAQTIAERRSRAAGGVVASMRRVRFNEYEEYAIDTDSLGLRVCPETGGSVAELSYKDPGLQLFDVVARRPESYHKEANQPPIGRRRAKNKKEGSNAAARTLRSMVYDRYPKFSFTDHLVDERTSAAVFHGQRYVERAALAGHPYEASISNDGDEGAVLLSMTRTAPVDPTGRRIKVEKELAVPARGSTFTVRYRIGIASSSSSSRFTRSSPHRFAIELNFGSLGDPSISERYKRPSTEVGVERTSLVYKKFGVRVELGFDRSVDLWEIPLVTLSRSESGLEETLQGVSLVPCFTLDPKANEEPLQFKVSVSASMETPAGTAQRSPSLERTV